MASGGPGLPPRPPVLSKAPGLAGLRMAADADARDETGGAGGEGETSDDGSAPLPDAGQRRPPSSFVIPPRWRRRGAVP